MSTATEFKRNERAGEKGREKKRASGSREDGIQR
jgi:hypothetical protein